MNQLRSASLLIGLLLAACTASTSGPSQPSDEKNPGGDDTEATIQSLEFVAPCAADACGEVPPSLGASRPSCQPVATGCQWSNPGDTVSFRPCEEAECGEKPTTAVCPEGTNYVSAQCGSVNDAACRWATACSAPPSTKLCPDAHGCDNIPLNGSAQICDDGSTAEPRCMQQQKGCGWENHCK